MGRFCLRYQAMDVAVGDRGLVVGRTDECDLVLDDPLVSRRHAVFRQGDGGLSVIDLGSRNGVLVNGKRISGPTELEEGDLVRIGSQELVVRPADRQRRPRSPGTRELATCAVCGNATLAKDPACGTCGAPTDPRATQGGMPAPQVSALGSSFGPLAGLADKALGMNRAAEAERVLAGALNRVLAQVEEGTPPDEQRLKDSISYALRLAEAGRKTSWLDYTFRLHSRLGRVMSSDDIDEVYRLTELLRYTNPRPVRSYIEGLRRQSESLRPNERFLLQRLEGLERKVGSG